MINKKMRLPVRLSSIACVVTITTNKPIGLIPKHNFVPIYRKKLAVVNYELVPRTAYSGWGSVIRYIILTLCPNSPIRRGAAKPISCQTILSLPLLDCGYEIIIMSVSVKPGWVPS